MELILLLFDFIESPKQEALMNAMQTLYDIGAADGSSITDLGRWISKLPIEPRYGLLVKKGIQEGILMEALVIASFSGESGVFFDQILQTYTNFVTNITPVEETEKIELPSQILQTYKSTMESMRVSLVKSYWAGKKVIKQFIGPLHQNRREAEETLSEA
ncbi:hypothetical protein CHS0354_001247 [Potamilus streckersoni]|uniref:Helicase-associated domain-containing protein n=1 Tax=Potamilus streckersoni TaxID=2493646 RepID=A0AAE0S3P8_9BIVA|nr:hypothetical protein CHS0354_001247 [Potamilus streckersoni]